MLFSSQLCVLRGYLCNENRIGGVVNQVVDGAIKSSWAGTGGVREDHLTAVLYLVTILLFSLLQRKTDLEAKL